MSTVTSEARPVEIGKLGLALDSSSYVPYYMQIVDQVRELIKKHKLNQGQTFCSEGEMAEALGISKMPVRQAFQKLRSEGLLIIAKGKRPVVGSGRVPWNFQQLRGFSEEMRRRGLFPLLLALESGGAGSGSRAGAQTRPDEKVYQVRRLRFINGKPVAVVTSFLPARIFGGIDKQDLENQSLYAFSSASTGGSCNGRRK